MDKQALKEESEQVNCDRWEDAQLTMCASIYVAVNDTLPGAFHMVAAEVEGEVRRRTWGLAFNVGLVACPDAIFTGIWRTI